MKKLIRTVVAVALAVGLVSPAVAGRPAQNLAKRSHERGRVKDVVASGEAPAAVLLWESGTLSVLAPDDAGVCESFSVGDVDRSVDCTVFAEGSVCCAPLGRGADFGWCSESVVRDSERAAADTTALAWFRAAEGNISVFVADGAESGLPTVDTMLADGSVQVVFIRWDGSACVATLNSGRGDEITSVCARFPDDVLCCTDLDTDIPRSWCSDHPYGPIWPELEAGFDW